MEKTRRFAHRLDVVGAILLHFIRLVLLHYVVPDLLEGAVYIRHRDGARNARVRPIIIRWSWLLGCWIPFGTLGAVAWRAVALATNRWNHGTIKRRVDVTLLHAIEHASAFSARGRSCQFLQ